MCNNVFIYLYGMVSVKKMKSNGVCIFFLELFVRGDKRKDLFIIIGRGSYSRGGVVRIRFVVIRWFK